MPRREQTPRDIISQLHALVPTTEKPLWQANPEAFSSPTPEMQTMQTYIAGLVEAGGKNIDLCILGDETCQGEKIDKYIDHTTLEELIRALQKLGEKPERIKALENIIIVTKDETNPNTGKPANGLSPVAHFVDEEAGNAVHEIHSGSIIIFPAAKKITDYRDELSGIPHIAGVLTHEAAHLHMACDERKLAKTWQQASGWEQDRDDPTKYHPSRPEKLPTSYAHINATEAFAESYVLYIHQPEKLKELDQEQYDFFVDQGL